MVLTLWIETRMKATMRKIVNWNNDFSIPLRVRKELSAEPNRPVPCPRTWTRIVVTSKIEIMMWIMLRSIPPRPSCLRSGSQQRRRFCTFTVYDTCP